MGKWVASLVAVLVVVVWFGGTLISSVQIKSFEQRASEAKKLLSDTAETASSEIESKSKEVTSEIAIELSKVTEARKSVEKQKEEFDRLIYSSQSEILGDAKAKLEEAVSSVEESAGFAEYDLQNALQQALIRLDVSDLPDLRSIKEKIQKLEKRAEMIEGQTSVGSLTRLKTILGDSFWVIVAVNLVGVVFGIFALVFAWLRTRKRPNKAY